MKAYLAEALNDEWLSIVDWRKFQRDHALHQPLTAYVVAQLLSGGLVPGNELRIGASTFLELCVEALFQRAGPDYIFPYAESIGVPQVLFKDTTASRHLWAIIIQHVGYFAALFHDIAYMWQYSSGLMRSLSGLLPEQMSATQNVADGAHRLSDRLLLAPLHGYRWPHATEPLRWPEIYREFMTEALQKTHGLPGGMAILNMADDIEQYPRDGRFAIGRLIIEWAALAIFMHDSAKLYAECSSDGSRLVVRRPELRIRFEQDPISAVLTLADTIQEFDRRVATFTSNVDPVACVRYRSQCEATQLDWNNGNRELGITYLYQTPAECATKRGFLPEPQTHLFDPAHGYLDLSWCGIDRVQLDAQMI